MGQVLQPGAERRHYGDDAQDDQESNDNLARGRSADVEAHIFIKERMRPDKSRSGREEKRTGIGGPMENHKYAVRPTEQQLKILKKYWKKLRKLENKFFRKVYKLEQKLQCETKIDDIEFYSGDDGGYVGIGNTSRTMSLIFGHDMEDSDGNKLL